MKYYTQEEIDSSDFLSGLYAALCPKNGKYYMLTEFHGCEIDGVFGKVKSVEQKKRKVTFVDLELTEDEIEDYLLNPSREVEYNNSRYLFNSIDKEMSANFKKGIVYVRGFKIAYRVFGYSIYDKVRKKKINEIEDNSDFYAAEQVIEYLHSQPYNADRIEALAEANAKKRTTILLRSSSDYKKYIAGKAAEGKSVMVSYTPNEISPENKFIEDCRSWVNKDLEDKKIRIRFKKRVKRFSDEAKRRMEFYRLMLDFKLGKLTIKKFLKEVENLI